MKDSQIHPSFINFQLNHFALCLCVPGKTVEAGEGSMVQGKREEAWACRYQHYWSQKFDTWQERHNDILHPQISRLCSCFLAIWPRPGRLKEDLITDLEAGHGSPKSGCLFIMSTSLQRCFFLVVNYAKRLNFTCFVNPKSGICLPPVAFFAFPQSCALGGQGLPQVVTDLTHLESVLCCCGKSKLTNPKPIQTFALDFGCWIFEFRAV